MVNLNLCFISSVLVSGIIVCMISNFLPFSNNNVESLLTEKQMKIYQRISKERLNVFLTGLSLGTIMAFLLSRYMKTNKDNKICLFTFIALTINILWYKFYPFVNGPMIKYLQPEQIPRYIDIGNEMKFKYYFGMIFGGAIYMFMGKNIIN